MDIATIGDIVDMATNKIQRRAFPRRYAYNNSQFSRQLSFNRDTGGNRLVGGFLIPPGHTLFSTKSSLTMIGKDTVDDDLQGAIGAVIMSIPLDYYPTGGSGENEPGSFMLNSMDDLETWVQERLPYVVTADAQPPDVSLYSMMAEYNGPGDDNFKFGPGNLFLNGYGRTSYDSAKILFTRYRKTHPIFGTGMMVGTSGVDVDNTNPDSANSIGGVYTPIDHSQTTIKRNVRADSSPVLIACIIVQPHHATQTDMNDSFPDLDIDANTYKEWVTAHDPYLVENQLEANPTWTGPTAQGGFKYLSVNYSDTDTDRGVPEDGTSSKWNCTWKFSAQIAPTEHPGAAPRNLTVNNLYRR